MQRFFSLEWENHSDNKVDENPPVLHECLTRHVPISACCPTGVYGPSAVTDVCSIWLLVTSHLPRPSASDDQCCAALPAAHSTP